MKSEREIIVASCNPVKLAALQAGFTTVFPGEKFEWKVINAPSGVSRQPATDAETRLGAHNRVKFIQSTHPHASFWCGIEGGIEFDEDNEMYAFAWVIIMGQDLCGKARSGTFQLPSAVTRLVKSGMELGDADDVVFRQDNSKQKNGAVGLLTSNLLTRTSLYEQAVILALIPFNNHDLYSEKNSI